MSRRKSIDIELSQQLAEKAHGIRDTLVPTRKEDLLLLAQRVEVQVPYFSHGVAIRLSPEGVFAYRWSHGERVSTGLASHTYSHSPFYDHRTPDTDGIVSTKIDPAISENGHDRAILIEKNGRLDLPKHHYPGELFVDFIVRLGSAFIGRPYKSESFYFDDWTRLKPSQKREIASALVTRMEDAYLRGEMKHFRLHVS